MTLLKIVIEPVVPTPGATDQYYLAVAIQSAPGYWKAYWDMIDHYPTLQDAAQVAATGQKLTTQLCAEARLGTCLPGRFDG